LFSDWFGVSVDAAGHNTTVAANVDTTLTKMKRALHNIIAGAAHIKFIYNTVIVGRTNRSNMITGFDFPTLASGYNDGANSVIAATPGNNDNTKWQRLFALLFFNGDYPNHGPKFYNAAVRFFNNNFNASPPPTDIPSVRLWRN